MANFTLNSDNNKKPGTAYADIIDGLDGNDTLSGLSGDDLLLGGNGLDSLDGGTGADTLKGGSGADVLLGNTDNDRLLGEDGNDSLEGGNGADTLDGGTGGDRLTGGDGDDYFVVDNLADQISEADTETGIDTVASLISFSLPDWIEHLILLGMETLTGTGNALNNRLTGNDAANGLDGGNGMDTLIGGAGADTLDGGFGVDELIGGDGDDLYRVSSIEDKLIETEGGGDQDEVQSTVNFSLIDYLENLTLTGLTALRGIGNRVANRLSGNAVANDLSGEAGDDTLQGGAGDDTLTGGQGNDVLDGGDGIDTVMFPGNLNGYSITQADATTWQVIDTNLRDGNDGVDRITGIERIAFADALKTPADFTSQLPGFSIGPVSLNEGNSTTTTFKFPVTLTAPASSLVTVNYSLQPGTASAGDDYLNKKGSLRFNPGEIRQFIGVTVKGDRQPEADETFSVLLAPAPGIRLVQERATGTIKNDDTAVVVQPGLPQLSVEGLTLTEGQSGASFATLSLNLSKPASQIVTVNYATRDDTATAGSDYLAVSNLISFTPGQTTASIRIPILSDTVDEPDERITVQLSNPVNAQVAAKGTASVIITDDDQPYLTLIDSLSVAEGDSDTGTARLEVTLSAPSWQPVSVRYTTQDDTARAGLDYTAMSGTLTFQPGETRLNLDIPILADTTVERDEVFQVQLEDVRNARLSNGKARVTLRNDDLPSLSIGGLTLTEGDSGETRIKLPVNLSTVVSRTVTVNYATTDDTARAGSDYTASRGSLTFAPGETLKTVVIPVQGDTDAEPDERFTVNLTDASNAFINSLADSATVLITNDDLPEIRMAALSQPEGNDPFRYISLAINLSAPSSQIILVNYATVDGTAINGSDYLGLDGSLTFTPGQTHQTLDIPVLGDTLAEANETFQVVLSSPLNARLAGDARATLTLTDDDSRRLSANGMARASTGFDQAGFYRALPGLSIGSLSLNEGTGKTDTPFKFPVNLSTAATSRVTVNYSLQPGSALAGEDYINKTGSLTFAPGTTTQFISVAVKADKQPEPNETFSVLLSQPQGASLVQAQAIALIRNDDGEQPGPPQISLAGAAVTEGHSGASFATLTLSLSKPASEVVSVSYVTRDGAATAGSDYLAVSNLISFAPGQTVNYVKVPVQGDTVDEPDESFQLVLSNPVNAQLAGNGTARINITDDDQPGLTLPASLTVTEGDSDTGTARLEVTLSAPSWQPVSVRYTTLDDTALAGLDYTPVSGTLTFQPGETRLNLDIPILADTTVEPDETLRLRLDGIRNARLLNDTARITLRNNDLPTLAISNLTLTEGNTSATRATLQVNLSTVVSRTVTVNYATTDDTARAGSDYTASRGSLTFAPGETVKTVVIPVQGDTDAEPDERFTVNLTDADNALISSLADSATVVLTNDDLPAIRIARLSLPEGNDPVRNASVDVSLSAPSNQIIVVNYATVDGTASDGSDYLGQDGSLTFTPGQTRQTLDIPVLGDTLAETDETFRVVLSAPFNARLDSAASAAITLTDDDTPPTFSIRDARLSEGSTGSSSVDLVVTLSPTGTKPVTVDYTTVNGTAQAGSDYTKTSGSLSFAPGETRKTINVPVLGDTLYEADESFQVKLANASSNARIDTAASAATVTVGNDDAQPVLAISGTSVTEGNSGSSNVSLTVSLSAAYSETVTVDYTTADGTARAGSDYTATSGSLSFAPGETRKSLSVPVLGDSKIEADEDFQVKLANASSNARIDTAASTATVQVANDDLPVLAISGTRVTEGNGSNASLTVSLSAASPETVTVDYTTVNGTAEAGSDYTKTRGTLSFAPGETRKSLSVPVLGDSKIEADESFQVLLRNAAYALLNPDLTAGTVQVGSDDVARTASGQVVQPVIDLGKNYGKLIQPVQVDGGHFFYYWDISGDGTNADTRGAGYANSSDQVTHDWLDKIFQQDVNGRVEGENGATVVYSDGDTDNTYRFATLNGVKLALPTVGNDDGYIYQNGTRVSGTTSNPTYDDYLAIWDAYNGTGTEDYYVNGTPGGWGDYFNYWSATPYFHYWSATPSASGHANIGLDDGYVSSNDTIFVNTYCYVAVEVW